MKKSDFGSYAHCVTPGKRIQLKDVDPGSTLPPWYIVPADYKWAHSLIISSIVVEPLKTRSPQFPKAKFVKKTVVV